MTTLLPARPHGLRNLVLAVASLILLAAACGGSDSSSEAVAPAPPAAEPTAAPTAEPTAAPTAEPTAVPTVEPAPAPTAEPTASAEVDEEVSDDAGPFSSNFGERGPYGVGVTTKSLEDRDVEIWYPVEPGAVEGQTTEIFDALSVFPQEMRAIVPPELAGEYDTLAVRDAAAIAGDFPVVIYGHGFGGYREIATHFTSHLASWGFVVASTDHLERGIAEQTLDLIGGGLFDETNSRPDAAVDDVRNTIELLRELDADGPLAATMNVDELVISGHSAGAFAAVQAAASEPDLIDGWISISGGTAEGIALSQPGLVIIGELDAVVPAERSYELYESVTVPRVLLNIEGAGHNSFTDPCRGILDLGGLEALTALLGKEQVARAEDGCTLESTEPETAQAMVNQVTIAWLNNLFGVPVDGDPLAEDVIAALGPVADYRSD